MPEEKTVEMLGEEGFDAAYEQGFEAGHDAGFDDGLNQGLIIAIQKLVHVMPPERISAVLDLPHDAVMGALSAGA